MEITESTSQEEQRARGQLRMKRRRQAKGESSRREVEVGEDK